MRDPLDCRLMADEPSRNTPSVPWVGWHDRLYARTVQSCGGIASDTGDRAGRGGPRVPVWRAEVDSLEGGDDDEKSDASALGWAAAGCASEL